jgi:hypothetical protein
MQRLAPQLIHHRFDDLRMPVPDVEDTETAEAIQIFAPVHVAVRVRPSVRPLDDGTRAAGVAGLAVFQEPRIDVIAEPVYGFARDPAGVVGRDLRFGDEVENGLRVVQYVTVAVGRNFLSSF